MILPHPTVTNAKGDPIPVDVRDAGTARVVGAEIAVTDYEPAARWLLERAREGRPTYMCCATVHMVMEAHDRPEFARVLAGADLVVPDGMPLVWLMRLGGAPARRVTAASLMWRLCELAAAEGTPVGFYGPTDETLERLQARLRGDFPDLRVAFVHSPPFRALSEEEHDEVDRRLAESGVRLLFVGLGCPKQEEWMARHHDQPITMLGMGAAFDFLAGASRRAPGWIQTAGLEWLFRLLLEPRRLWRRYLVLNPRFLALALRDAGWRDIPRLPSALRDTERRVLP